jgi:hypothetical protein
MPSPGAILATLASVANEWRGLAIVWHALLAALVTALGFGWRPSIRLAAGLLTAPFVSVAAMAWWSGNPFNGVVFLALSAVLARAALRLPDEVLRLATPAWCVRAAAVVGFGTVYPHFVQTDSWSGYVFASPFGLIPCPTLAVGIGMTLAVANLRSVAWAGPLLLAGAWYAAIGVFVLGVTLDWGLFIAAALLGAALAEARVWRSVRADRFERSQPLPGDELIPRALGSFTHAISIRRDPQDVWPWLVQMGAGTRAGWYSYDWLDNGRRASATRVVPELQAVSIGTVFPALPGELEVFRVLQMEPDRTLVLGWSVPDGGPRVTWAFVLEPRPGATRLIVRVRAAQDYRFRGLPQAVSLHVIRLVHFVMQRRQLLGIAHRVESWRTDDAGDSFLDRFMSRYDVVERHRISVVAPADVTLAAAADQDLLRMPLIRAIFRAREIAMRAAAPSNGRPRGLLAMTKAIGWGVLAEVPGREVVMGAVTRPWEADVTFRALPPAEFAAFSEPGFVKIAWTLRADPVDGGTSIFRTETRAVATDAAARERFRKYWAWASPGIALIRRLSLRPLKREAERRARQNA